MYQLRNSSLKKTKTFLRTCFLLNMCDFLKDAHELGIFLYSSVICNVIYTEIFIISIVFS